MGADQIERYGAPVSEVRAVGVVVHDTDDTLLRARMLRDQHYGARITYSPKVFIPVTQLCRDVCHYCTFAKTPSQLENLYLPIDDILETVKSGARAGCREVLLTLGEKPELRYRAAREWLAEAGYVSTVDYVAAVAERIVSETGLLPHINAGTMTRVELAQLRPYAASMGLMLETGAVRLSEKGGPHYGSPDKAPWRRWLTLARAGALKIPMTTGLLVGIGETREERLKDLHGIRRLHERYGHIQEVIIQNFCAKAGTKMAGSDNLELAEMIWTIAQARAILPIEISIQAPPNLNPGQLGQLIDAGINDWGGVSPLTPDYVNPEAPWPSLSALRAATAEHGKQLLPRLTAYPRYLREPAWMDPAIRPAALELADADGLAREDDWRAGASAMPPVPYLRSNEGRVSAPVAEAITACLRGEAVDDNAMLALFSARGAEVDAVCSAADTLRQTQVGDEVTYVVNRNINYTNVCQYSCRFCAFSKGGGDVEVARTAYDIDAAELHRRVQEAASLGATEVCLQGGIHPDYTGQTYLDIVRTVKEAAPDIHIHAFSPLEIDQGAATLQLPVARFLEMLRDVGLRSMPGTAAEVLDEGVRSILCPDKVTSQRWLDIMEQAHGVGLHSTATIMFGHVDDARSWVRHWRQVLALQQRTQGFTEVVPLPFVSEGAPIYRRGGSRPGPTWREALLMHAVLRLTLGHAIPNVQASWVKLGQQGALQMLSAGANDLGGVLINESITRAAGAAHGQVWTPSDMQEAISGCNRSPRQRTTLYGRVSDSRAVSWGTTPVRWTDNTPAGRKENPKYVTRAISL